MTVDRFSGIQRYTQGVEEVLGYKQKILADVTDSGVYSILSDFFLRSGGYENYST